ncbi:putative integral membrane protein [Waddlia chondrophila 2032/99]|uniref:Putative integral membrane protein n=2 Tax=Waddlia chondrophila TaxID=71667 RepID=D6YUR9_WADCW|nr:sodium:proton antiporter [Waddlia chondrophila]ADI37881.1 putative integral membrane protein [Waddlia chondrophila WSU 86-1044]CCB91250.1 putative integral membrane protein [Waddlia chondrophila 2032/99]
MEDPFFQLSIILIVGLLSTWIAELIHIPNILLMLLMGFLVGPITGLINPQELFGDLLLPIVSLSVAIILFEGGLSLEIRKVKKIGPIVMRLVIFSTLLGIVLAGIFLQHYAKFSYEYAVLLASILVITGPTVIIPLLQQLHIKEPARSILRWEGIIIDPIGAITAVLIFEAFFKTSHSPTETFAIGLSLSILIGVGLGVLCAFLFILALKRYLIPDILHNSVVLLLLIFAYSISNYIQTDSGLVTATVMGFTLANQKNLSVKHIVEFKESLRVILIAFLFITLAASIDPQVVLKYWKESLMITLFLLFIVRPLVVFISTFGSQLSWREKTLMIIVAPRGIVSASVASLFALELAELGFKETAWLTSIVFSVIALTVCFCAIGTFVFAPLLKLASSFEPGVLIIGANSFAREVGKSLSERGLIPYYIDTNFWKASEAKKQKGNVFYGSFISFEEENQDTLAEIGVVLALTENDEVNSLAINHFSRFFDREQLYQFHPETEKIPNHLTGRGLFSKEIDHSQLRQKVDNGSVIRSTQLTKQFGYKEWKEKNPKAIPLFLLSSNTPLETIEDSEAVRKVQKGAIVFLDQG